MKKYSLIVLVLMSTKLIAQSNWYVDYQNGSNANNGTTQSTAVKTIDYLTKNKLLKAKDTVLIVGQYNNPSYNPDFSYGGNSDRNNPHIWHKENTVRLNGLHGNKNGYITFKPFDNTTVLKGDGANIFRVINCSYLRIEGFEMYGEVENIPLSEAEGLETGGMQFLYLASNTVDESNPKLNEVLYRVNVGTTIAQIESTVFTKIGSISRPSYIDTRGLYVSGSNHIEIINNTIHHTPGGGMRVSESSYVNIISNEIHNCSRRSYSGTHALVVTKAMQGTANTDDDDTYSIKIERNTIRDNYNEMFSWVGTKEIITPRIDEGKGISLQRNNLDNWQTGSKRILVANNLCYWNGFSGAHSNDGYHIDFINNTCYMNSYTNTVTYADDQKGNNIGISAQGGDDIRIINNISVIDADWNGFALASANTTNLVVSDNLIYGLNGIPTEDSDVSAIDENTTIADPLFVNATNFDFSLSQNSPAIGVASSNFAPTIDFFSKQRDSNPDLGAVEYFASNTVTSFSTPNINVYPNPFHNRIVIKGMDLKENNISIFNMMGQDMRSYISINSISQNIEIDTTILPEGMYLLRIENWVKRMYK